MDIQLSSPVNYCNNCGQKVESYPGCHTCIQQQQQQQQRNSAFVPLPAPKDHVEKQLRVARKPLPSNSKNSPEVRPTLLSSHPSDSSRGQIKHPIPRSRSFQSDDSQTARQEEESIYYTNYAVHLQSSTGTSGTTTGPKKKLWKKVRNNERFKDFSSKVDKAKPNTKLWGKFIKSMADKIPTREDRGPESDGSDWEGETHVSRVLREYYEKKQRALPYWLYDNKRVEPRKSLNMLAKSELETPRKQRLWERESAEQPRQQKQQQPLPSLDDEVHFRRPNAEYTTATTTNNPIYNLMPSNIQYTKQQQPHLREPARYSTSVYEQRGGSFMQQQPNVHSTKQAEKMRSSTNPFENTNHMASRVRVHGPRDPPAFQTKYTTTTTKTTARAGSYT